MAEIATFLASFPPIMSAIKVDGAGGGMRIQFDVPESEMGEAVKLLMWREVGLKVTIEPVAGQFVHSDKSGIIGNE
jgi:hypothetical protein